MKKFVLVMVFVLLTALFIAFNYLLWDRESKVAELKNLENANASYYANINAQKREINTLEGQVSSMASRIERLESEKTQLSEEQSKLMAEKNETTSYLQERVGFINVLKQHIDINTLTAPVTKWVEAVNIGDYEEAYALEYAAVAVKDRKISMNTYSEGLKISVHRMEINEAKVDRLRGLGNGDIYIAIRLNVKLAEGAEQQNSRFTEGINDIYVKIDYSAEKKEFIISAISTI